MLLTPDIKKFTEVCWRELASHCVVKVIVTSTGHKIANNNNNNNLI